ncbi:DUF4974 domain-containing protein [Hymenobacter tibetensis]|uniref:DUF4974 domain-containing protein n=1 Tax=Hymenobacter tibetensis TaxID=497967 RepID=A0ABY4CZ06_9BACT|nr:DUF4974 domain-containing protein [Hymenobacter tibetensis]UOG75499.1 DUF4974 domain-containing protein [Hymenobacter tibetensis]
MQKRICLGVALLFALASQPISAQVRPGSVLERKVTVTFQQAPLESVLHTLRRQYGVRISYSNTALNLQQPVTLHVQNQPLRSVLNTLLADKNIGYELVGDQVVLHPARATKSRPVLKSSPASSPTKPASSKPTATKATASKVPVVVATSSSQPQAKAKPTEGMPAATTQPNTPDPVTPTTPASDSTAAPTTESEEPIRTTLTKKAQVSFLGPLGSNGLRAGQTVNHVSLNVLGGYAAGVDGFEAAGLFNVDRDTVAGVQVAGLANVVGRHLEGFQGAGLLNVLGGTGTGWQAAGLLNVAARPVNGIQTAGLFNYAGPVKPNAAAPDPASAATDVAPRRATVQAAGLFNVSLNEVRGIQAAGLFNAAGTVHGVQLAGLLNVADSVDGVSIAPLNFVRHGYHRFEATNTESWPVGASLKLGGSAAFYTFFAGAYDDFGSGSRRWALGYGAGTELLTQRRISVGLDAVALHVNEEQRGWTDNLNLHNQLRLLVGFAPFKAGGHLRLIAGPTVSVLVTQRYDSERGQVYSHLGENRRLWLEEGSATTRVLGWFGYCAGVRF